MRKTALAVFFLFLVGAVSGFTASMEAAERTASAEDPGKFLIKVENNGVDDKIFRVSASPYSSWFYTETSYSVPAGENHTFELIVTPPGEAIQQNYRFDVSVNAGEEIESFTDYFTVQRETDLVIRAFSTDRKSYKPGETAKLQVEVLNTAPQEVEEYSLRASMAGNKVKKQGLPLSPSSSGMLALNLPLPENAAPGERTVKLSVLRNGKVSRTVNQTITVERVRRIERKTDVDNRLLFYTHTSTVENAGNYPVNATVNTSIPDYLRPITSFEPLPDRESALDDATRYTWSYELPPGASRSVSYTTEYWIPGSILTALLAGLLVLKKVRTRVAFKKRARETEEGVKIHIELENRSSDPVREITVRDFVPDIASVIEEFPMAKPIIRRTSNGTRLSWEIEELEPGSQRVFEYTIKPMFEVEGGVELPSAKLESGGREVEKTETVNAEFHPDDT